MKRLAILACIPLAACATPKYIVTPCATAEQVAEREAAEPPKVGDQLTGNAAEDVRVLAGSSIRLRSWGQGNLDILKQCAEAE